MLVQSTNLKKVGIALVAILSLSLLYIFTKEPEKETQLKDLVNKELQADFDSLLSSTNLTLTKELIFLLDFKKSNIETFNSFNKDEVKKVIYQTSKCLVDNLCGLKKKESEEYFDNSSTTIHQFLTRTLRLSNSLDYKFKIDKLKPLLKFNNKELQNEIINTLPSFSLNQEDRSNLTRVSYAHYMARSLKENKEKTLNLYSSDLKVLDLYLTNEFLKELKGIKLSLIEMNDIEQGICFNKDNVSSVVINSSNYLFKIISNRDLSCL